MILFATSQGKSKTSSGIISDSLDENKIRDRELLSEDNFKGGGGTLTDVPELQFIIGNCPMMYLSSGPNIHVVHRSIS